MIPIFGSSRRVLEGKCFAKSVATEVTAGVPQPVTMAPTTMAPTTMAPTTVVQPMRPVVQPAAAISATTRTVASTMMLGPSMRCD